MLRNNSPETQAAVTAWSVTFSCRLRSEGIPEQSL